MNKMNKIDGDIIYFLNAIGEEQGSKKILDAIAVIATDFDINSFKCEAICNEYFQFFNGGVDFVFEVNDDKEILGSIFLFINGDEEHLPYKFTDKLIVGLYSPLKKLDIINKLSLPEKEGGDWIRYIQNDKYIHFEFDEDNNVNLITIFN